MAKLVRKVQIKNFKSISEAVVCLSSLTILVGRNGAGKSNFIDALSFVQQCLSESIELAFKNRGGIAAVRRRSGGHPTSVGIALDLDLDEGVSAHYAFEIAARQGERFQVAREKCVIEGVLTETQSFEVRHGAFVKPIPGVRSQVESDRLALFAASATPEFRPVYDFLTNMRFYSIVPSRLREWQDPDQGDFLNRDGSNAAAVLKHLRDEKAHRGSYEKLCRLLSRIVDGLQSVEYQAVGQKETLQFRQDIGLESPWRFDALSMSDGTLRVLGLLLAVLQPGASSVVGIEEPEATVHPAAAELLISVLQTASLERQLIVTTHSPDILDAKDLAADDIRVVTMDKGRTAIAPVSEAGRRAIREHLYTAGELMRVGELGPDTHAAQEASSQLSLFRTGS